MKRKNTSLKNFSSEVPTFSTMIFFFAQAPIVMVLCWKVRVINMKKGYETKKNFEAIVTA